MSSRREARAATSSTGRRVVGGDALPLDLAHGPCMEDWTTPGEANSTFSRAFLAWRRWQAAVDEWVEVNEWETEARPGENAYNLATTKHPWSRAFLIARGEVSLLAFYEGRLEAFPGRDRHGWDVG